MEQMRKGRDFHKRGRYHSRKKVFWKLADDTESGNGGSLPGKYLSNDFSDSSHRRGPSEGEARGEKWYLENGELKRRKQHRNTHVEHSNGRYNNNNNNNNMSGPGTSQADYDMSYDMFPPLRSQINVIKTGNDHGNRNQTAGQRKESKQSCWKEESKDHHAVRTQHSKNESNFEGESRLKWPLSNFWNVKQEGVQRRHNTASLYERETNAAETRRSTVRYEMTEDVKSSYSSGGGGSNSLRGRKGHTHYVNKDLTPADSKDIPSKHFQIKPNESHSTKDEKDQSTYVEKANDTKAQDNECVEGDLMQSGSRYPRRTNILNHGPSSLDIEESSGDSYSEHLYDDDNSEDATLPRKNDILSYLKLILKTQNQESPKSNEIVESKCVPSSESPVSEETQESQPSTEEADSKREKILNPEDQLLCEEMLNNYIVLTSLPFGVSKEEVLYHISKVGPVSYLIMENNKAHVIFLKPEHAETAFGTKHVLFGKELVVYRPKRPSCTLHLSGLTNNTPNKDIIDEMSKYGLLLSFYRPVHKITGAPMQYCFVKVGKEVAESILNQTSLSVNGVRVFVEVSSHSEILPQVPHTRQTPSVVPRSHIERNPDGFKIWFSNVPRLASYDLIKEHFQEFGRLHKVFVRNRRGFVIFASQDGVDQAMSSRHTILGSEVKICRGSVIPY